MRKIIANPLLKLIFLIIVMLIWIFFFLHEKTGNSKNMIKMEFIFNKYVAPQAGVYYHSWMQSRNCVEK